MPEELDYVHVPQLDSVGIIKNISPEQIPSPGFQDGLNVRFREGAVEVALGWIAFSSTPLDSKVMWGDQYFLQSGSDFLLVFSKTTAYQYFPLAGILSPIQPAPLFTGSDDQFFDSDSGGFFGTTYFLVTNGKDPVQQWLGSGPLAPLGGLTNVVPMGSQAQPTVVESANIVRFFSNFVVLLKTTENGLLCPLRVRWSQFGQVSLFINNADGTGQAGADDLDDSADFIQNADRISSSLAIFKERSIYLMTYVGTPAIFQFQRVISGIGLYAPRAYANMGDEILFLGNDNFYSFNGYTINPIPKSDTIKNFFFQDLNPAYGQRVIAFVVEEDDEILFWYPSVSSTNGEINKAIVFNYVTLTWSFRTGSMSSWFYYYVFANYTWLTIPKNPWITTSGVWADKQLLANAPLNLFGDINGKIWRYGSVYSQGGANYDKYVITRDHDFGSPVRNKRLLRVDIGMDKGTNVNVNVYVGHRANIGENITFLGPYTLSLVSGSSSHINVDVTDVYFSLKIETTGQGDAWELLNYTLWFNEKELVKK